MKDVLTFVVPVYNEQGTLLELVERSRSVVEREGIAFRMLLVDDGSTDGSRELIRQIARTTPGVTGLLLRAHFGKSAALAAGFAQVSTQWTVMLDSDLQDQPEELPKLLKAGFEGADLVSGRRTPRVDPPVRRVSSTLFNTCASCFAGMKLHDCNSGYKLVRTDVARRLTLTGSRHRLLMILAKWDGFMVIEVPVSHGARKHGRSKYGPFRPVAAFFDLTSVVLLEKFRHRPMHFFGSIGAAFIAAGVLAMLYLLMERLAGSSWITNRPLFYIAVLLIVLGANIFTTGLLAEFVNTRDPRDPRDMVSECVTAAAASEEEPDVPLERARL
jgi:glycosyltransferase involved in cell wall biosynthesis